jgi:hypothetical protein
MQVASDPIATASACTSEKITAPIPVGNISASFSYKPLIPGVQHIRKTGLRYVHEIRIIKLLSDQTQDTTTMTIIPSGIS